jgi:hypothetical protein
MLMPILDRLLSHALVESIRDEALGDIWEAHHRLIMEGRSIPVRTFVTIWRALLLVCASIQIASEDKGKQSKGVDLPTHLLFLLPRAVTSLGISVAGLAVVALLVLHSFWIEDLSYLLCLFQNIDLLILAFIIVGCVTSFDLAVGSRMVDWVKNATKEALEI